MPSLKDLFDIANNNLDLGGQTFDKFVENLRDTDNRVSLYKTLGDKGVSLGKDFTEFNRNVFSSPDFYEKPSNWEAFKFGMQSSGVAIPFAQPTATPAEEGNLMQGVLQGVGQMIGDLPIYGAAAIAATGGVVGTAGMGVVPAAVAGAAGMALPAAIREVMMDKYENGEPVNFQETLDVALRGIKAMGKPAIVGGLTGGTGRLAGKLFGRTAEVTSDVLGGTTIQTLVEEGRLPTKEDIALNAVPFIGLHGATMAPKLIGKIYRETGVKPSAVSKAAPGEDLNKVLGEINSIIKKPKQSDALKKAKAEHAKKEKNVFTRMPAEKKIGLTKEEAEYMTPSRAERESPLGAAVLRQHYLDEVQRMKDARATQPGMSPDVIMDYEAWWRAVVSRGEVVDILPPAPPSGVLGPGPSKLTVPTKTGKKKTTTVKRTEETPLATRVLVPPAPKPPKGLAGYLTEATETSRQAFWKDMGVPPPKPWSVLHPDNTDVTFKSGRKLEPTAPVVKEGLDALTEEAPKRKIRFSIEAPDDIEPRTLERVRKAFAIVEEEYPRLVRLLEAPKDIPGVHPVVKGGPLKISLKHAEIEDLGDGNADLLLGRERSIAEKSIFSVSSTGISGIERLGIDIYTHKNLPISRYVETIKHELTHLAYTTHRPLEYAQAKKFQAFQEIRADRSGRLAEKKIIDTLVDELKRRETPQDVIDSFVKQVVRNEEPFNLISETPSAKFRMAFYDLLDGIYEVLGGERMGIIPQGFDKVSFDLARPKFEAALKHLKEAGMTTAQALDELYKLLPDAKPYLDEFKRTLPKVTDRVEDPGLAAWQEIYGVKPDPVRAKWGEKTGFIRSIVSFPEQAFKGLARPAMHSARIIEGDLYKSFLIQKDQAFIDTAILQLPGSKLLHRRERIAAQKAVRPAAEHLYKLRKENPAEYQRLVDNSKVYEVAHQVIEWFDHKRRSLIDYKLRTFEMMVPDKMKPAFFAALHDVSNKSGETSKTVEATVKRLAKEHEVSSADLLESVREYHKLQTWGLPDYLTNIERGMWRVIDKEGQVRAVGLTRGLAEKKMAELKEAGVQFGEDPISPEFHEPVNPLEARKNILRGEENIFDAMRTYSYIVNRKMTLDPIRIALEKAYSIDPTHIELPKWTRKILSEQLKAAYGEYGVGDKFFDDIAKVAGTKPMLYTRGLRKISNAETILKMGWKPIGGAINLVFGKAHTYWYNGVRNVMAGHAFLKTPEGKAFLARNEPYLGQTFAVSEGGLKAAHKPFSPLWFWEKGEANIRPECLAANYLRALKDEKSPTAAEVYARHALRLQQVVYNSANLPLALRAPINKYVLLKFKSYFANEFRVFANLPGADKMKMLGTMIALTGPAGLVATLKSIPFLGTVGFFQDVEEWLANKAEIAPNVNPAYGLPGLAGINISSMATPQFFSDNPEDYFGAFIGDMIDVYKGIVGPVLFGEDKVFADLEILEAMKNMTTFLPIARSWMDLINYNTKDGWVRDGKGIQKYQLPGSSLYNRLMLLSGVSSVAKTKEIIRQRSLRRWDELDKRNSKRLGNLILRRIDKGESIPDEWMTDVVALGMDVESLIKNHKRMQNLTPENRAIIRGDWVRRLKAMDIYEIGEKKEKK